MLLAGAVHLIVVLSQPLAVMLRDGFRSVVGWPWNVLGFVVGCTAAQ